MNELTGEKLLDISWRTLIKISITIIAFYIIFSIKDILVWFLFALVISVLFNPIVDFLQRKRVPRILGVILVYLLFFGTFSVLIYLITPLFIFELRQFIHSLPEYLEKISPSLQGLGFQAFENVEDFVSAFGGTLEAMTANIFSGLFIFFGGIITTLFVIITALFLSLEEKPIEKILMLFFPKKYEALALNLWERSQRKVSAWFGARILACLFVGVASYITFLLFNVQFPFTLGLFSGVFNFIPYIGPFATAIVLFFIIFPTEMLKAVFVLIAFALIQQIEGSILSPILMKKIVGIPPSVVLVSLVIGAKLWGVLGAILVIPLVGILFEFGKEFLLKRREREVVVI
ncbi:MAG: AI-2E family transporter [Candidatus Nealsonbacteria bacterium]